jgi:hypothetical protein
MQTYIDGIPFYANSVVATVVFGAFLFGVNYMMAGKLIKSKA